MYFQRIPRKDKNDFMSYQVEQKWIEYWNVLYELMDTLGSDPVILDESMKRMNVDEAQTKIQNDVYEGKNILFLEITYQDKKAIMIKNG